MGASSWLFTFVFKSEFVMSVNIYRYCTTGTITTTTIMARQPNFESQHPQFFFPRFLGQFCEQTAVCAGHPIL